MAQELRSVVEGRGASNYRPWQSDEAPADYRHCGGQLGAESNRTGLWNAAWPRIRQPTQVAPPVWCPGWVVARLALLGGQS